MPVLSEWERPASQSAKKPASQRALVSSWFGATHLSSVALDKFIALRGAMIKSAVCFAGFGRV
jgi:hypothetical protein